MSAFFEQSVRIADDFIQTVVLIDDRAYTKPNKDSDLVHFLDAGSVTSSFAKKQKFCSVYKPEHVNDLPDLKLIAKKADVVILDWYMDLKEESDPADDETVVSEADPRGTYTLPIIESIISPSSSEGGVKLIIVYTGEVDLAGVADKTYTHLKSRHYEGLLRKGFEVFSDHFRIIIVGKPALQGQYRHTPELEDRIVKYDELPSFVVRAFSEMTSGLLSDFMVQSLCILRNNTSRLLSMYHQSLDPALVSHCALLPEPEDAQEQLIDMLTQSVSALLKYQYGSEASLVKRIDAWLDDKADDTYLGQISLNVLIDEAVEIKADKAFLKEWVQTNFSEAYLITRSRVTPVPEALTDEHKANLRNVERNAIHKTATRYFTSDQNYKKLDQKFSVLTHHKSNVRDLAKEPVLTLGSIIRTKEDEGKIKYYVCIQQRCDSVRLNKNEVRQFLFLPLKKVSESEGFNFTVSDKGNNHFLKVDPKTYNLTTIEFTPVDGQSVIKADKNANNQYQFISTANKTFVWLSDLKDAHAQRLANEFSAKLARVGLDESEWLRRWSSAKGDA
jgi:hypothetical protein